MASCITPDDPVSPEEHATVVASARHAFAALPGLAVPLTPGEPEYVRPADVTPEPGYWLVAGRSNNTIQAVARILRDGRVATVGHISAPAADAAEAVTGLSGARVASLTGDIAREHGGRIVSGPVLVHDGPVGREAWLLVLQQESGETLRVFATAGGTYVRR
ncbi:MAG TPA: hypothetical protein VMB73_20020 [Acetobacteraceae bacterium]|nr:hypothetical protein [Acetobacteraceae bacterium]